MLSVLDLIDISFIHPSDTGRRSVELHSASSLTFHLLFLLLSDKGAKGRGGGETERVKGCAVVVPTHLSVLGEWEQPRSPVAKTSAEG